VRARPEPLFSPFSVLGYAAVPRLPVPCRLLFLPAAIGLLVACSGSSSPTDPGGGTGGRISGTVFSDTNGNGTREPGEPGVGGVTVEIFRDTPCSGAVAGSPLSTVTTPASGQYTFTGLATSATGVCYVVRVSPPAQHAATSTNPRGIQLRDTAPARDDFDFGIHQRGLFFTLAGSPTPGSLYLSFEEASPGATTWTAELRASSVQNLYGIAFDLHYPEGLLTFTDASEGSFLGGEAPTALHVEEASPGRLVVGLTRLGNFLGANGSGVLMRFDFSVAADGHGEMRFTDTTAYDGAGQPKGFNWRGGSVLVLR
jgi:hypothetical protein